MLKEIETDVGFGPHESTASAKVLTYSIFAIFLLDWYIQVGRKLISVFTSS